MKLNPNIVTIMCNASVVLVPSTVVTTTYEGALKMRVVSPIYP